MAFRAARVPVLRRARPVLDVAGGKRRVRVQVEPSLAARGRRARVPRDAQCLIASARQRKQVLLQRLDAERVGDVEIPQRPIGAVGADDEAVAVAGERGGDAVLREALAGKRRLHAVGRRRLHRARVHGLTPSLTLRSVTLDTRLRPDEARCHIGARARASDRRHISRVSRRRAGAPKRPHTERRRDADEEKQEHRAPVRWPTRGRRLAPSALCHEIDGCGSSADVEPAAVVKQGPGEGRSRLRLPDEKRDRATIPGPTGSSC